MKRTACLLLPLLAACVQDVEEPRPWLPTEVVVTSVAPAPAGAGFLDFDAVVEGGVASVAATGTLVADCTAEVGGVADARGIFTLALDVRVGRRPCDGAPGPRTLTWRAVARQVPAGTYRVKVARNSTDGPREVYVERTNFPDVTVR